MKPELKLIIDIKADIENAKFFVKHSKFVDWFLPLDLQYIISKKFSPLERNKIISEYTKHIHKINEKEILKGVAKTRKQWSKIEDKFFQLVDKIFCGYDWPKGKYIGYASIYLMFPRNIKEKTFYFPYSKNNKGGPIRTIAHEMLHFIFFDYIKKKYGINENDKFRNKNQKYVWQVSETFNTVIENWGPYMKIFNAKKKATPYPGCEKMFISMTKQWNKKQDVKNLLDKWLIKKNLLK